MTGIWGTNISLSAAAVSCLPLIGLYRAPRSIWGLVCQSRDLVQQQTDLNLRIEQLVNLNLGTLNLEAIATIHSSLGDIIQQSLNLNAICHIAFQEVRVYLFFYGFNLSLTTPILITLLAMKILTPLGVASLGTLILVSVFSVHYNLTSFVSTNKQYISNEQGTSLIQQILDRVQQTVDRLQPVLDGLQPARTKLDLATLVQNSLLQRDSAPAA